MSQRAVIEQSGTPVGAQTAREARYVAARLAGKTKYQAMRAAGFSHWIAKAPSKIETPEIREQVEQLQAEIVGLALNEGLVDAVELHERLSDEDRGDYAELYNPRDPLDPRYDPSVPAGDLLPIDSWPMWARQGGVEFIDEPNMVHSDDDGGGSWDQKGRKIRIVGRSRAKTRELLMKHRAVNAMVQAPAAQVQVNVIDAETVQLATLLSPEQLESVRQRVLEGK